jgi:hypothetical protein
MRESANVLDIEPRIDERPSRLVRLRHAANRTMSLAVGGGLIVAMLLLISRSMREEAALSSDSAQAIDPFLPYYGEWEGVLRTSGLGSEDPVHVPMRVSASMAPGGRLRMRMEQDMDVREAVRLDIEQGRQGSGFVREVTMPGWSEQFEGRLDATGAIVWTREAGDVRSLQREWVDRDRYYIEGFTVTAGNPPTVRTISGRLDRRLNRVTRER